MNYKLTATTCNETIAFQFIEFWTDKGYQAYATPLNTFANDGYFMGNWRVYRSTKKQTK
tara:strand:- start:816 stop:992 length:177 start_codon:yes stop_codon:yes gene_type:complete